MKSVFSQPAPILAAIVLIPSLGLGSSTYVQSNLTSDLPDVAANQDPNLVNPWGITSGPTTPIWISDNGTGLATLYNGSGVPQSLVVTIPPPAGGTPPAAPDGVVFNSTGNFGGARFIFSTEDGTIAAWSGGTNAILEVDNSASGAVYKGIATDFNGSQDLLYATNFNAGTVDVYNSSFTPTTVPGGFLDPMIPSGFAPFGIANIGGLIYVTYALQDPARHDDVAAPGNGFVDVFNPDGTLVRHLISQGPLNSPWGLALAPSGFGSFSGDLLVGNFGDGSINVFNPTSGGFLGTISDSLGNPIVNQGLWGLAFGNGAAGTNTNALYFTAGIPGPDAIEDHGLFGDIQLTPEPGSVALAGAAAAGLWFWRRRRAR